MDFISDKHHMIVIMSINLLQNEIDAEVWPEFWNHFLYIYQQDKDNLTAA